MRLWEASPGCEGTHRSVTHTCDLHWLPTEHIIGIVVIMSRSHAAIAPMLLLLLMAALLLAAVTSPAQAVSQHEDPECLQSLSATAPTATATYRMCRTCSIPACSLPYIVARAV